METLKAQLEALKEKIKAAWAETQERAWFIALKERYQELPPAGQTGILYGVAALVLMALIFVPISNLMDASDQNDRFDERRQVLKELLRLQRDIAAAPNVIIAPPPSAEKVQLDGKLSAAGVKPEQIKASNDMPAHIVSGTEQHGLEYRVEHLTVRQAVDIAYELEHTDPGFKLQALDLAADMKDPHFYNVDFKVVSFAPKVAEIAQPGEGIANAIKGNKGAGNNPKMMPPPPAPGGAPNGAAPAIPSFKRGG
jgi:hypothetical protein